MDNVQKLMNAFEGFSDAHGQTEYLLKEEQVNKQQIHI